MKTAVGYLIDASVFIQAARQYYAFDIVPSFWPRLLNLAADGTVFTIDRVYDEILRGKDALAAWMVQHFSHGVVCSEESSVVETYSGIIKWVFDPNQEFRDYARNEFASGADPWLIAYAAVHNCCVVTQETYKPGLMREVPIPNVQYTDTFEMMRRLAVAI